METTGHPKIIKTYRDNISQKYDKPFFISQKRLSNTKWLEEMSFRNSTFLKNARLFYDISKTLYWDTKPILTYYSMSYLLSFFANSFIVFNGPKLHHGISIKIPKNDLNQIKVQLLKFGSFQRIVKSLSFIYYGSIFSDYIVDFSDFPSSKDSVVELYDNSNNFSIAMEKDFLLNDLIEIKIRDLRAKFRDIKLTYSFEGRHSRYIAATELLKNYILVFTSGYLARYNPYLWKEIYEGETSDLFLHFKDALESVDNAVALISKEFLKWENNDRFLFHRSLFAL